MSNKNKTNLKNSNKTNVR